MDIATTIREAKEKVIREYCSAHGIEYDENMPADERARIIEEYSKEADRRREEETKRLREEKRKRQEAEMLLRKQREYEEWVNSSVPKRYREAKKEDFKNTVSDLFSFEQSALILGANGIGKSHLGWAIAKEAKKVGKTVSYVSMFYLMSEVKKAKEWIDVIMKYSTEDILIIDEMDKCIASESDFVIISEIVGKRYNDMLPTIVIGNGTEQDAQRIIGQSAYSRLTGDGGKLYCLNGVDRRRIKTN